MKPIAIFRHLACEGPGYFADFLLQNNLKYTVICIDQNDPVPESIEEFSALVFMGGPMSVNDELPWITQELDLIRQAAKKKMPVLGHCLGGQLIAKALGGRVSANSVKEIGWHSVQKLENSVSLKWTESLPEVFEAFHWHGETFSIPQGAAAILKSQYCDHQAFAIDNILALQCHVEMNSEMVIEWTKEYASEIASPAASIQSAASINDNVERRVAALNQIADRLYQQWIQPLVSN